MSDPVDPLQPPVPYAVPAVPAAGARPGSVSAVAGIGIAIGALGLLCKPANLLSLFVKLPQPDPNMNAFMEALRNDPVMRGWGLGSTCTGVLISLLLLMSSLGSFGLKPWARTGMLAYAWLALLTSAVSTAVEWLLLGPQMERTMQQAGVQAPPMMAFMGGPIGHTVIVLTRLWLPILILAVYLRRDVREAFERGPGGTGI